MSMPSLRLSVLVTADDVVQHCGDANALSDTLAWCRDHGIDKVYLETYRGQTEPPPDVLRVARRALENAGIEAAGCLCTTDLGVNSEGGWPGVPCFTRGHCGGKLESVVGAAAALFDELIIDNRLFTDCLCHACHEAKGDRSWTAFRQDLLLQVCRRHVIQPARNANPEIRLVFKYPSWYEGVALRGYDVRRHTDLFDGVCAGAETRDPASEKWGKRQPFGSFFTSHWYHRVAGGKCVGSWIDTLACSPEIFLAQARGSVLGGARELILFCLGHLREAAPKPESERLPGARYVEPLCAERERLNHLAALVTQHPPTGIAAYRSPVGDAGGEPYVFEHLGMLGLPLIASPEFPDETPVAVFAEASHTPAFATRLTTRVAACKPTVLTSRLQQGTPNTNRPGGASDCMVWDTGGHFFPDRMRVEPSEDEGLPEIASLVAHPTPEVEALRQSLLAATACPVQVPPGVGVTLLGHRYAVVQNYATGAVEFTLGEAPARGGRIAAGGWRLVECPTSPPAPRCRA